MPSLITETNAMLSAEVRPALVRIGDDWNISAVVTEEASGSPIDLTGSTVSGYLYVADRPVPFKLAAPNGNVSIANASAGQVVISVFKAITKQVPSQKTGTTCYPTCLSLSQTDANGHRHTFDPIAILPLTPRDYASVAVQPSTQVLVVGVQGPAGPGVDLTNYYTKSQVDMRFAALDDPFIDALIFG